MASFITLARNCASNIIDFIGNTAASFIPNKEEILPVAIVTIGVLGILYSLFSKPSLITQKIDQATKLFDKACTLQSAGASLDIQEKIAVLPNQLRQKIGNFLSTKHHEYYKIIGESPKSENTQPINDELGKTDAIYNIFKHYFDLLREVVEENKNLITFHSIECDVAKIFSS